MIQKTIILSTLICASEVYVMDKEPCGRVTQISDNEFICSGIEFGLYLLTQRILETSDCSKTEQEVASVQRQAAEKRKDERNMFSGFAKGFLNKKSPKK